MNEHDQVIELLKNYRSYQMAILNYKRHIPSPAAGIANYNAQPGTEATEQASGANEIPTIPAEESAVTLESIHARLTAVENQLGIKAAA